MTIFAIEREGSLVNHVVFKGDSNTSLYRERNIEPLTFTTLKAATEIAGVLHATVVDYDQFIASQVRAA